MHVMIHAGSIVVHVENDDVGRSSLFTTYKLAHAQVQLKHQGT